MKTRIPPGMGPGTAGELSGTPTNAPFSKEPRPDPIATVRSGPPVRNVASSPSDGSSRWRTSASVEENLPSISSVASWAPTSRGPASSRSGNAPA